MSLYEILPLSPYIATRKIEDFMKCDTGNLKMSSHIPILFTIRKQY
jgi:hypothetical protein